MVQGQRAGKGLRLSWCRRDSHARASPAGHRYLSGASRLYARRLPRLPLGRVFVEPNEAGLSEAAWQLLGATDGQAAAFSHPPSIDSLSAVRAKIYGHGLTAQDLDAIVTDVADGRYADIEISALLTACAAGGMTLEEVVGLTTSMVKAGDRLSWDRPIVADKHCVGGLPGNRTTPIVVAIVAAAGVCIPKTSSRAITSLAGTADVMETLAPVNLDLATMRRVVERENGCIVWGASVRLSPVDDVLIRVERALDLDSDAQLVASVLSKKVAAGSSHVVIDVPIGPTAKVRTAGAAAVLVQLLEQVGRRVGLQIRTVITDGSQPIGRGIGPALEARDVLSVIRCEPGAPQDLRAHALRLSGEIFELVGACEHGGGEARAAALLDEGAAWRKLERICEAQGGMKTPPSPAHHADVVATEAGTIVAVDNRRLARTAKLAGAPGAAAAGVDFHVRVGETVERGQPLFTVQAESPGELAYANEYLTSHPNIVSIGSRS